MAFYLEYRLGMFGLENGEQLAQLTTRGKNEGNGPTWFI